MFIAEIGINHNGNIVTAFDLIDVAKEAGADVVKFQKRNVDACVPEDLKNTTKETPWGTMSYLDYKKYLEFEKLEYDMIDAYCKEAGIKWTASVWDEDSLDFILQYDVPFIKIPSAMLTNHKLLNKAANSGKPIVLSIGMSTSDEVIEAITPLMFLESDLTILHCNSSYPTRDNELDLSVIPKLRVVFADHGIKIGYSGHEEGIHPTIVAASIGAEVIERHITLDKNMWGSDQRASLEPDELKELVAAVKKAPSWLGEPYIKCYLSEEKVKKKLRRD